MRIVIKKYPSYLLQLIIIVAFFSNIPTASGAEFRVVSNIPANPAAWSETPEKTTGLQYLAVVPHSRGYRLSIEGLAGASGAKWSKFSNAGAAYAEPVDASLVSHEATSTSVSLTDGDAGYMVECTGNVYYAWVTDYSAHRLELTGINVLPESDCSYVSLGVNGKGSGIAYYTITGRRMELSREMKLTYRTAKFNEETFSYEQTTKTIEIKHFDNTISAEAPYTDTDFTLEGDRFLEYWQEPLSVKTGYYQAVAVEATEKITQEVHDSDNQIKDGMEGVLGGSAPVVINLKAVTTDAAVFKEWQISKTREFEDYDITFPQENVDYVFNEAGTSYIRFQAADNSGKCMYTSEVTEVYVGESQLLIPNAFSPTTSPGVNDIWKVSYKSLIKFECHIFNSRGTKIYSFTNPDEGWDGKYKGKAVSPGVYYYVIVAEGSDGKHYKKAGDINIVGFHGNMPGSGSGDDNAE